MSRPALTSEHAYASHDTERPTSCRAEKRKQIWGASDILDELEDLGKRIEIAALQDA